MTAVRIMPGVQMPHCAPTSSMNARWQRVVVAQSFDRRHLGAFDLGGRHQAGADRFAVDQDGAGAALPLAAPFLGAGEAAVLAQHVEQPRHRRDVDVDLAAVQGEAHAASLIASGSAGIAAHVDPEVPDGVDHRGGGSVDRQLAQALGAERPAGVGVLQQHRRPARSVERGGNEVVGELRVGHHPVPHDTCSSSA